jgi:hypothetical protein
VQTAQLVAPDGFGRLCLQGPDDLRIETTPISFGLALDGPIDRFRDILDGDVHGTILEPSSVKCKSTDLPAYSFLVASDASSAIRTN